MSCPHCQSPAVRRRRQRTALGYRRFSCGSCHRRFNERTGTPFNELQYPTDIVLLAVLWRLRYKLGLPAHPNARLAHRVLIECSFASLAAALACIEAGREYGRG